MKTLFKKVIVAIITWEAKMVLKKYKPKVVAITGSVGKTSTKDAVYTVLASSFTARRSQKSFNSELGVPLTILDCPNGWFNPFAWLLNIIEGLLLIALPYKYPEWLVLEVGADRPGDIKSVSAWLQPDISVITRFGSVPVHVEFFPSIDDLVREKGYLAHAVKPQGTVILNTDDERIAAFAETIAAQKLSYGFMGNADVKASNEEALYGTYEHSDLEFPAGIAFQVEHKGVCVPLELVGSLGRQHAYPLLAAFSVGVTCGIDPAKINEALKRHVPPPGRMRLIPGIKDTMIIDDTYNSSPVAVAAALDALRLAQLPGRRIAVLGDMLELGQYSVEEHKKAGKLAAGAADVLVTVGVRSRMTADAALDALMDEKNIYQFESSREAGKFVEGLLQAGDIVLVKGSQSMRMERIVEEVMAHPEYKEKLLVRQEREWQAKK